MRNLLHQKRSLLERINRFIGLFLLAPALALLTLPVAIHIAQKADSGFQIAHLEIISVRADGPAERAGLRPNDAIIKVNNQSVHSMTDYHTAMAGNYSLKPIDFEVLRNNALVPIRIHPTRPTRADMIQGYSEWVAGLAFLLIGWWVLLRRHDQVTWNFFALCFIFAFFLLDIPDSTSSHYMEIKDTVRALLESLMPAYFLRFFLLFPHRRQHKPGVGLHPRVLLIPGLLVFVLNSLTETVVPESFMPTAVMWVQILATAYYIVFFLIGLLVFARRIQRRDRPIQRSKMLVLLTGLLAGLIPFLTVLALGNVLPGFTEADWQYLGFSLLLVPTSFGLAIMRYGALDKAFVVRASLIYGLLTALVLLIYFVLVMGVGHFLSRAFSITTYPVLIVIVAASGLAILPMRRFIQNWIDNTFYPARRANREAITSLADHLSGLINPEQVTETLVSRLATLFRPTSLALFLRSTENTTTYVGEIWTPETDSQTPPPAGSNPSPSIPANSGILVLLDRMRRPLFAEEIEELLFSGDVDADSLTLLTKLKTTLLIPLVSGNQLLGFLAFGPKSSGALFSQEDLANLRALGNQAASVLESRRLYQAMLQRKKLETELELARDIQASLLPTESLTTPQYTISGRNEPCRMVGGDYFDYFLRPDGALAFAIADVAGKGIPAALQMTSLRVAFRREAETGRTPRDVICRLNPIVAKLITTEAFICLFYGVWNPATGVLTYCNAGMDPPVLFRTDNTFRQTLKKGGPVLGVVPDFAYREGRLVLQSGDRLFLYTDGLTEEQNKAGDFFEVDRLLQLVEQHQQEPSVQLLNTVFYQVNEFGGSERSDDKTAILLDIN